MSAYAGPRVEYVAERLLTLERPAKLSPDNGLDRSRVRLLGVPLSPDESQEAPA